MSETEDADFATAIGQEIVFRVAKTRKGCKVTEYNGLGLAEGIYAKSDPRYFSGEDAKEKATQYAYNRVEESENKSRVVELGEKW